MRSGTSESCRLTGRRLAVRPYKCPLPMVEMDGEPLEEEGKDMKHLSLGSLRGRLPAKDFTAWFLSCQDILVDE